MTSSIITGNSLNYQTLFVGLAPSYYLQLQATVLTYKYNSGGIGGSIN